MSFFVYFNTESNKFNFIQGDGQLQISNGQPVVKTNTVDMKYIDPTDKFEKCTIPLNSNNKYIWSVQQAFFHKIFRKISSK